MISGGFVKPFGLNFIRMLFTSIILWLFYLLNPQKEKIIKADYGRLISCALLGIVINQLLFIKGLSTTYSIHGALLMLTTPIFITIIAASLLKEKISNNKKAGLIMGIIGAAVLVLARKNTGTASDVFLGDMLIILNAISFSCFFVLVKPLMHKYNTITVIRMIFTIGTFIAFPICWPEFSAIEWSSFSHTQFEVVILIVFGGTVLTYLFNVYGIKHLGPTISGSYIYTQPVFATIIAIVYLGESLELYKVVSAFFIFLGVYLARRNRVNTN